MGKKSVASLLTKAQQLVDGFELDEALKVYKKALKKEPNNVQVLDLAGEVAVDAGRPDMAAEVFSHSSLSSIEVLSVFFKEHCSGS